ncbi:ASKHA domain-containing protein [Proteiniborus sp. MB09-C3]|uniref:ASKHA domain-containing protein n=1 Tax=Proteiniborus sp. MB09-C3 TaxID=3050072 RepID=UPI002556BBD2|nr:ASKHA domain-containing protein [Proteiniborus sp. MB09-C3]WIV12944.1 ASKHA domain-containing protein [Proteiniborus sp. MB09-C3]
MPNIFIHNKNKNIEYIPNENLMQILIENDVFVDNPCNGNGFCGKCKIKLLEGELPQMSETEGRFLRQEEIADGIRLSCLVIPNKDITIEVLQREGKHEILEKGYMPHFNFKPTIKKILKEIVKPTLNRQIAYEDSLCEAFEIDSINWRLLEQLDISYGKVTGIFYDEELIDIETGDTTNRLYGVAVDIGTTTIVAVLIDIITGKELATASRLNPQKKYGLDVLTRITYSIEYPKEAGGRLQQEIVAVLNEMIEDMSIQVGIDRESIYEIAVAGNTTMLHFLLGIDAATIGKAPYFPIFIKSKILHAEEIGLRVKKNAILYCLPSVSAYIGADIVAGAYICQLHRLKENTLFVDIGTNGEMILSSNGRLLSCSCAAGPALEGMNISSGMRAAEGAIEDVRITEAGFELKVIGNQKAVGICGSGVLAAVKELLRVGLVKRDGAFIKKEKLDEADYRYEMLQLNGTKREFILTKHPEKLLITQGDLRQVQLAKGAILSGFHALLKQANIEIQQLDRIMIAGQFGAHLPSDSLIGLGILPKEVKDKLVYVGNSSKTGAYMALMSSDTRREMEALAKGIDYMELGASEGYEELFAKCLMFP